MSSKSVQSESNLPAPGTSPSEIFIFQTNKQKEVADKRKYSFFTFFHVFVLF